MVFQNIDILGSNLVLPVDKEIIFHFKRLNNLRIELCKFNLDHIYWEEIFINIIYQIKDLKFMVEE